MDVDVTPAIDHAARRALVLALSRAGEAIPAAQPYERAWRRTAFAEAVDRDGRDRDYALSPRSTRGATRA